MYVKETNGFCLINHNESMNLSNVLVLRDNRTNCWSISTTVSITDYCDWFIKYGKANKLEDQRPVLNTRSGNMIRARLIEDLKQGAVIPPIVVGMAIDEDIDAIDEKLVSELFNKYQEEVTVIDGMQRSEALSVALASNDSIHDNLLRMDIWVAKDTVSLVYRMLVLNTGQVPWDVKRQMEVIYKPLIKETKSRVPAIIINTKNDNTRRSCAGEYQASSIVELFIAFTSRKEIVSSPDRVADDFIRLDVTEMSGKPNVSDYFYRTISLMVSVDQAFSNYRGDEEWEHFRSGKDLFARNTVQAGFVGAIAQKVIGMPGMTARSEEEQERYMRTIEQRIGELCGEINSMTEANLKVFMSFDILNEKMSNLPTKKIGNVQREFFRMAFKTLVEESNIESLSVIWQSY